jgi:hypothetical protein
LEGKGRYAEEERQDDREKTDGEIEKDKFVVEVVSE